MPSTCCCSAKMFSIQYVMSCKRERFVTIRHNDLRDLTANLLSNASQNCYPLLVKIFQFERQINVLKQDLILNQAGSGLWVNKHSLIWEYLTKTLKDTLTQLFHNATHNIRNRKRGSAIRGFCKLSTEISPVGIFNTWRYESRMQYVL